MKRIAIVGSHGVGKTTLCHQIVSHYMQTHKVVLHSNLARTLIARGYSLNKDATAESYIQYVIAQLEAEQEVENCDLFISDRTLLDPLAYETVNSVYEESVVPEAIRELLLRVWLLEKERYDLYVFVPIEFAMSPDGVRPLDETYRVRVEQQLLQFLEKYNINFLRVCGTPIERCQMVCRALDEIGRSSI